MAEKVPEKVPGKVPDKASMSDAEWMADIAAFVDARLAMSLTTTTTTSGESPAGAALATLIAALQRPEHRAARHRLTLQCRSWQRGNTGPLTECLEALLGPDPEE